MPVDVAIPEMGESVSEVILLEWIKSEGEYVERDEPICVLETDKANVDLPSPAAGVLHPTSEVEATLAVGDTIATIDDAATAPGAAASETPEATPEPAAPVAASAPAPAAESATSDDRQPTSAASDSEAGAADATLEQLSPAVRRLVDESGIDPTVIVGTGRGGRIIKQDILAYLKERERDAKELEAAQPQPAPAAEPTPAPAQTALPAQEKARPKPAPPPEARPQPVEPGGTRRVAMTRMRKRIAERLVDAQRTAAMLTTFNEVDLSEIMALRKRHKERFQEKHGVSLGLMSFFSRATILSLLDYETVNASIEGDDIVYHDYVNLGIAVSSERGVLVPILQRAELMSMADIEREIKRLALAARDNKLGLDELTGGTFTITNGGVFGSLLSTPILTPPQTGILGMHAIKQRPVAVAGEVAVRPMMNLALSYDHRLVDGEQSVKFLVRIVELLEDPARLMLEI